MPATLIPTSLFENIPAGQEYVLFLIAGGAIAILVFGADKAVGAAARLAAALGMSKVIIGATVVSLGTTMPEATTSVLAAFAGKPGLALGNGVGSIICDTALIFGTALLVARLPRDPFVLYRHGVLKLAAGGLLVAVVFGLAAAAGSFHGVTIPRVVGVAFLLLLAVYMYVSVRWARAHPSAIPAEADVETPRGHLVLMTVTSLLTLLIGLALVVLGSDALVGSVSEVSLRYGVPPDVLAVTMVAFGTSLPELVTAVTAVIKGHGELMIGNVIGADILNVLFVIGASAAATPLKVPVTFFYLHLPAMVVALGLMGVFIFATRGATFRRWQGLPLVALYVLFILLAVLFGTVHQL